MTITTIAPAALVAGVARQPLPYGLFSVLTFRPEGDGRWEAGATFESLPCEGAQGIPGFDCEDPEATDLDLTSGAVGALGEALPFTVYGHFKCSPVGWSVAEARSRAVAHLQAREEARVEQALWTGDLGNIPALATADATVLNGDDGSGNPDPHTIREGVALLEGWLAENYGSLGVIHMTRTAATLYRDGETSGGVLRTPLGTPIVAGAGYPGTGPEGEAVSGLESWMYASPALLGYRSEVNVPGEGGDLLDRGVNDLYALAMRTYLIGFDPCGVAAVLTDGGL